LVATLVCFSKLTKNAQLHNNVGVSIAGGDKPFDELTEAVFDRVSAIKLRGTIMACKHVLPIMRRQRSGAIVNISSVAAYENTYPLVAYKATKAAMIAFTEQLALHNAPYGIRANCIIPGLMDTPMAVDTRARASNRSRAEVAAERDARVAAQWTFEQTWGKAPPYDPNQEREAATLDLGRLKPEQRRQLRELLQQAVAEAPSAISDA
jgi:NAD(P)-dependent dehydrogenase (short-subunit alcohol dehydrogenase family)